MRTIKIRRGYGDATCHTFAEGDDVIVAWPQPRSWGVRLIDGKEFNERNELRGSKGYDGSSIEPYDADKMAANAEAQQLHRLCVDLGNRVETTKWSAIVKDPELRRRLVDLLDAADAAEKGRAST